MFPELLKKLTENFRKKETHGTTKPTILCYNLIGASGELI
jgi:hypothetical protein